MADVEEELRKTRDELEKKRKEEVVVVAFIDMVTCMLAAP